MHKCSHQLGSCAAQWVTKGHRTTVHIDFLQASAEMSLCDRQRNWCKCFVNFNKIDVTRSQSSSFQCSACGRNWPFKHHNWIASYNRQSNDFGLRLQAEL